MHRRTLLETLAALPLAGLAGPARAGGAAWVVWRDRFVMPDGRVVDDGQDGISHSEGQAYGLLLAQAEGDREAFDRIEGWARANLANRQDALMSWAWDPAREERIADWHNASDGDLLRAWALLRAGRDSGWPVDMAVARAIAGDIAALCLAPDPRVPEEPLLRPGAEARIEDGSVLVNPSYYHPRALRELATAFNLPALARTADHGTALLAELAALGPIPDWIEVTTDGFAPARDHAPGSSYDALRVPLYLAWSGMGDHPAATSMRAAMQRATQTGHVAVAFGTDGTLLAESDAPGYRAIAALGPGTASPAVAQDIAAQPYYPATLGMLCKVAAREGHN